MKLTVLFHLISLQEVETKEIKANENYFMSTRKICKVSDLKFIIWLDM
jgi:hypothetical protein